MATFGPYPATVLSVHDGDTVTLEISLGFDVTIKYNCRIFGINAPELSTPAGKLAAAFTQGLMPIGAKVSVLSHGYDKYGGRFDGTITLANGSDVAALLLNAGQAVPFNG